MHKLTLLQAQALAPSSRSSSEVWLVDLAGYVGEEALRPVMEGMRSLRRCLILGAYPDVPAYA